MALLLALLLWIAQVAMPGFDSNADYYVSRSGWTVFTPTTSGAKKTRQYYVSSSIAVDDSKCGLAGETGNQNGAYTGTTSSGGINPCPGFSGPDPLMHNGPHGPKKTVSAGISLLRDTYPDWLLLRSGDSWSLSSGLFISKSGPSASEKMLVSSYGSGIAARPKISVPSGQGGWGSAGASNYAIVDINFESASVDPNNGEGITIFGGTNILIEGCLVEKFMNSLVLNPGISVSVRRNVLQRTARNSIFTADCTNVLIEENVLYRGGYDVMPFDPHGMYISLSADPDTITIRDNIIADMGYDAMELRATGVICENNLVARCPNGIQVGGGPTWASLPNGTNNTVTKNCIVGLGGPPFSIGSNYIAFWLSNINGTTLNNNIAANPASGSFAAFRCTTIDGNKVQSLTLSGNVVYGWGEQSIRIEPDAGAATFTNLSITNNDLSNSGRVIWAADTDAINEISSSGNRFSSSTSPSAWFEFGGATHDLAWYKGAVPDTTSVSFSPAYPNAGGATISGYMAYIGHPGAAGATHDDFMGEAIKQRKGFWRPAYTAQAVNEYIRQCFGKQ